MRISSLICAVIDPYEFSIHSVDDVFTCMSKPTCGVMSTLCVFGNIVAWKL